MADFSPHNLPYSEDLLEHVVYYHNPLKGVIVDETVLSAPPNHTSILHQPREAVPSLGNVILPLEILHMVLLSMPYPALRAFMAVNSAAFNIVMAMPEFRILSKHGRNVVRMLERVRLHNSFSTANVYEVFTSPSCTYCGSFGAYVFLPGLLRCCQNCAENDYRLLPISKSLAKKKINDGGFNLTPQMLDNLPMMTTQPGTYASSAREAENTSKRKKRVQLLSRPLAEAAIIKGILQNDPEAQLPNIPETPASSWTWQVKIQVSDPLNLPLSHRVVRWTPDISNTRNISIVGNLTCFEKLTSCHPQRSMALAPMPYFDQDTQSIQEGFRCRGCSEPWNKGRDHTCTEDCHARDIQIKPRIPGQISPGLLHRKDLCVLTERAQTEYLRHDFQQHFEQCDRVRIFYKKFRLIIATWERDGYGDQSRMSPEKMSLEFLYCAATKANEVMYGTT